MSPALGRRENHGSRSRYFSILSSSPILPSLISCKAVAAAKVFPTLPASIRSFGLIGVFISRSETPTARPKDSPFERTTPSVAPGKLPDLCQSSSLRWSACLSSAEFETGVVWLRTAPTESKQANKKTGKKRIILRIVSFPLDKADRYGN